MPPETLRPRIAAPRIAAPRIAAPRIAEARIAEARIAEARIAEARIAEKAPFRRIFCKTMRAPPGSGKPANPLFFRPILWKRVADGRATIQGLLSFCAGFCGAIGKTLRTAAVPKSEAVQGIARSAARSAAGRGGPSRQFFAI